MSIAAADGTSHAGLRRGLLRGALCLAGLAAAGLAAAHFDLVLVWMIPACLIGLVLGVWSVEGTGAPALASAILLAGVGMTVGLIPSADPLGAPVAGPFAAADAPAHPRAAGYRFAGARVATDYAANRTFRGARTGGTPVTWHAAPVVDPGWDKSQPIPVWVIAQETTGSDPRAPSSWTRWREPMPAALRIGAPSHGRSSETIAVAEQRHGLISRPDAVIVTRSDDPEADRGFDMILVLALLAAAIVAQGAIASRFWERRA